MTGHKSALAPENKMTQKEINRRNYYKHKKNGECPRCGKRLDREGHYCSKCLEKVRIYHRENRKFFIENHICTECGKVMVPNGERTCPECRGKNNNRRKPLTEEQKIRYRNKFRNHMKALYQERTEQEICTRCGKRKAMPGKKKCGICLAKDAEIHRRRYMDRPDIKEYRKEHHLCYFCGEPINLPEGNICSKCQENFIRLSAGRKHDNEFWRQDNRIIFGGRK